MRALVLTTLCTLLLTACSDHSRNQPFATYLDRLGRTLGLGHSPPALAAAVPRRPRSGALRIPIGDDDLGMLDFMALRGCALQQTLGKRNSILGRHARDSQRLLLELEYLRLAPACIAKLEAEGKAALALQLARNWESKQAQLPARIFNATLGGEEYAALWWPTALTPDYPDNTSSAPVTALAAINALARQWLAGDYRADNREFELLLHTVASGDGGSLWLALDQQAAWLRAADDLLARRAATGPLCYGQIRPQAATILPLVVHKFFIQGIQPRAAILGRRYHQLLPPARALETQLEAVLPPAYGHWRAGRDRDLEHFAAAPRQHVQQLHSLLHSCGGL